MKNRILDRLHQTARFLEEWETIRHILEDDDNEKAEFKSQIMCDLEWCEWRIKEVEKLGVDIEPGYTKEDYEKAYRMLLQEYDKNCREIIIRALIYVRDLMLQTIMETNAKLDEFLGVMKNERV